MKKFSFKKSEGNLKKIRFEAFDFKSEIDMAPAYASSCRCSECM